MSEKREELLTRMIRIYGMEHEIVIMFAKYVENPKFDEKLLEAIVKCHEEHPLWENEDEDE